jgi:CRP/FNR family transcriptional regulator, cyclic AMP receptor protein
MSSTDASGRLAERLASIRTKTFEAPALRRIDSGDQRNLASEGVALDGIRLLQSLSVEERRALEKKCTLRRFAAGATIIERFSAGSSVLFLQSGVARVVHNAGENGEITIATVGAGNTLGEIAAIDGLGRTATILAESDCVAAELPSEEFGALLGSRAELGLDLLRRWASVIRQLDEKISFLSIGSPDQRVYAELLRLAKPTSMGGDRWVIMEMPNHREIAVNSQTSREVVIRVLAELARAGTVERRAKTLHINGYDALRVLASAPPALPQTTAQDDAADATLG